MMDVDTLIFAGRNLQRALTVDTLAPKLAADYSSWIDSVAEALQVLAPQSGLLGEWLGIPDPELTPVSHPLLSAPNLYLNSSQKTLLNGAIALRMNWLGRLPSRVATKAATLPETAQRSSIQEGRREIGFTAKAHAYVNPDRIEALRQVTSASFSLDKLVRLCEEINIAYASECYYAVAMLQRAILDHVPPVFGATNFAGVAAGHGGRSAKAILEQLEKSTRKISDVLLHGQIAPSVSLPTPQMINAGDTLDFLLGEVVTLLGAFD